MCVNHVGSNLRYQKHCEPWPRGATQPPLTSYTTPPSTSAATCHCKLCARVRRAVEGVRLRIQATLRSRCKRFCKLCCQGCGSTRAPRAETQRGAPAEQIIGARAAQRVCKLRRVGHAARARRPRLHTQSKPGAQPAARQRSRARAHDRYISMNGALQMLRAQLARGRCARSAVIASVRRCPMRRAAKDTHNTDTSARTQCTNTTAPRALSQRARPTAAPRGLSVATCGTSGGTSEPVAATPARGAS